MEGYDLLREGNDSFHFPFFPLIYVNKGGWISFNLLSLPLHSSLPRQSMNVVQDGGFCFFFFFLLFWMKGLWSGWQRDFLSYLLLLFVNFASFVWRLVGDDTLISLTTGCLLHWVKFWLACLLISIKLCQWFFFFIMKSVNNFKRRLQKICIHRPFMVPSIFYVCLVCILSSTWGLATRILRSLNCDWSDDPDNDFFFFSEVACINIHFEHW